MISYLIHINSSEGRAGYFSFINENGILVNENKAVAHRYESEEAAEEGLLRLEKDHGLNREEADIEAVAFGVNCSLRLGNEEFADCIEISQETDASKPCILVRASGFECTEELTQQIAEQLAIVLDRIKSLISKGKNQDGQ